MRSWLLFLFFSSVEASVFWGSYDDPSLHWQYIGKFCFDVSDQSNPGRFYFDSFSAIVGTHQLVMYNDDPLSWPATYNSALTCEQRLQNARPFFPSSSGTLQSMRPIPSGSFNLTVNVIETERPRFWYVVVANCAPTGLRFDYNLAMLNPGNSQFSADKAGLLPMYGVFFGVYVAFLFVYIKGLLVYYRTGVSHPIITILTVAIVLATIAVINFLIFYGVYGLNGFGIFLGFHAGGEFAEDGSLVAIMILSLLVANGWAITFPSIKERRLLLAIAATVIVLYFVLFIWERSSFDPAMSEYAYLTLPGILILTLSLVTDIAFIICLSRTYKVENRREKRGFYILFGAAISLRLVTLPLIVGIAEALPHWQRLRVVSAMTLTVHTLVLGLLAYILSPYRVGSYFRITSAQTSHGLAGATPYDTI